MRYNILLPHGLRFWLQNFETEEADTNVVLEMLDIYIKNEVGLKERGLFWKLSENAKIQRNDKTFNIWTRWELRDWFTYWLAKRHKL